MKNIINSRIFKKIYQKLSGHYYNVSYSQTGEDVIIDLLINAKGIKNFNYIDIGANHPVKMNNTYMFYEQGYNGICIEPDPLLFNYLKRKRYKDICLNVGIGAECVQDVNFFVMENPLLNTFSEKEAQILSDNKYSKIKHVLKIDIITVEQIINKYLSGNTPSFINIDVEGLDEEIIQSFPFQIYRPYIFCIETVNFSPDASSEKRFGIIKHMESAGYKIFADTYINTIFIDSKFEAKTSSSFA